LERKGGGLNEWGRMFPRWRIRAEQEEEKPGYDRGSDAECKELQPEG